jgi:hypothetical protein
MNVRLVFNELKRHFLDQLASPAAQVPVQFILQEATHFVLSIFLFHDHDRRVLREGFLKGHLIGKALRKRDLFFLYARYGLIIKPAGSLAYVPGSCVLLVLCPHFA